MTEQMASARITFEEYESSSTAYALRKPSLDLLTVVQSGKLNVAMLGHISNLHHTDWMFDHLLYHPTSMHILFTFFT